MVATIEDEESQDKKFAEIDDMSEEEVIKKISQADARVMGCFSDSDARRARK